MEGHNVNVSEEKNQGLGRRKFLATGPAGLVAAVGFEIAQVQENGPPRSANQIHQGSSRQTTEAKSMNTVAWRHAS